ncbi:uncharacterized protein METZ01_LOCUS199218, partial [marine metagenome]
MAEPPDSGTPAKGAPDALEGGAYDLIKQRLSEQAKVLREALDVLGKQRESVFGSRTLQLKEGGKGQANVSTELNCEPRDMVELGQNRFLFGFNVH